jgi:hypothetical protein
VSLRAEPHLYVRFAAVYWAHSTAPNAFCIKCYDFQRSMNSSSCFIKLRAIFVMIIILYFPDIASLSSMWQLTCPAYNISARTTRKTPFLCCSKLLSWKHACLRSHYLKTAVVLLLISRSLLSNMPQYIIFWYNTLNPSWKWIYVPQLFGTVPRRWSHIGFH